MEKTKRDMSTGQILGYGLGSLGKDFVLGAMGSYLLLFYTDILGISAAAAGVIILIAKVWDAINDPMMGVIADRRKVTKWGRYRPFILLVPIPLAVFAILTFYAPNVGYAGKIIWALVTYIGTGMLFTAYDVPLWGMLNSLTQDANTRNKLITVARWFSIFAIIVASVLAMPIVEALGGGNATENYKVGFPLFMAIFCGISIVFAIITFFTTNEKYIDERPVEKVSLGQMFRDFIGVINTPLIMCLIAMICYSFLICAPTVAGGYYMIYYIGNGDLIPVHMMASLATQLISSAIAPAVMKKTGAKRLSTIAFAGIIIVNSAAFLVGSSSLILLFVLFGVSGFFGGFLGVTITTLVAETCDYVAEVKGYRADGTIFSMNSFAAKVGNALGSAIISFILSATGYVALSFEQTSLALNGIMLSRVAFPIVTAIVGLVCIVAYRVPKKND